MHPNKKRVAIALLLLAGFSVKASEEPYTVDAYTLHLWQFDELSGISATNRVAGGLNLSIDPSSALGGPGATAAFEGSLDNSSGAVTANGRGQV